MVGGAGRNGRPARIALCAHRLRRRPFRPSLSANFSCVRNRLQDINAEIALRPASRTCLSQDRRRSAGGGVLKCRNRGKSGQSLARSAADGQSGARELGASGAARRFLRRGARMRFVFLIGMLATLSGCASYRDVTFLYYPNAPHRDTFPASLRVLRRGANGMRRNMACARPITGALTPPISSASG